MTACNLRQASRGAAFVNTLPLTGAIAKRSVEIQGYTVPAGKSDPLLWLHVITPEYFNAMEIPLVAGRQFAPGDLAGAPAAIITAATARQFWGDRSPIGEQVRFKGENHWRTIVGIAGDVRAYDLTKSVPDYIEGTLYVPYSTNATMENGRLPSDMAVVVRTRLAASDVQALDAAACRRHRSGRGRRRRAIDAGDRHAGGGRTRRNDVAAGIDGGSRARPRLHRCLRRALVPRVATNA